MASPGPYPQMPPGNPAMSGPPMGAMPPPARPVRQGTSRAVPVVVSAGLAVGVFCGLLFGLGTDHDEASASTTASNGVKSSNDDSSGSAATTNTPDKPKTDKPADKPVTVASGSATPPAGSGASTGSATPAAGSASTGSATPAAGSGASTGSATVAAGSGASNGSATHAGSASAPPPAKSVAKLILDIKPDPGPQAKITIDGKDVTGTTFDVDLGADKSKTVKVAITAPGFHSYEQKVDVKGDTTVAVELAKRAATYVRPPGGNPGVGTPVKPNGKDGKGGKKGGGGVIDL